MKYSLYLFDFDLTLADTYAAIFLCFRKACRALGMPLIPFEKVRPLIGIRLEEAARLALELPDREGENARKADDLCRAFRQQSERYMNRATHFFPQTIPALKKLRFEGAKLGVVSSKEHNLIQDFFYRKQALDLVDYIVGGTDVEKYKPDPEPLHKAMEHFGVPKEEVLYVGDSWVDAQAARAAGVDFAAVLTGTTDARTFWEYPHRAVVNDVGHIPHIERA